jgi:lipoate-protein ligase B
MEPICRAHWLGQVEYQAAWDLQNRLAGEIAAGKRPATLLLLEHPHTFTFGRRGQAENLLWDETERQRRGIQVYWVDRGGDVTYHGPGQLVGYPLLALAPLQAITTESGSPRLPQADYVGYLRRLESVLMRTLGRFGLAAERVEGLTGVWVRSPGGELAKIASIGVKVDARGVTRHGFALNVAPDMRYWEGIIGCGLADKAAISLAELLPDRPDILTVAQACVSEFGQVFGFNLQTHALEASEFTG